MFNNENIVFFNIKRRHCRILYKALSLNTVECKNENREIHQHLIIIYALINHILPSEEINVQCVISTVIIKYKCIS